MVSTTLLALDTKAAKALVSKLAGASRGQEKLFGVLRAQLRPERVGTRPVRHLGTPPTLV